MLFAVSQVDSDRKYLIIALITVALSLSEVTNVAGFGSILMEIAPNYMGILQGINNSLGLAPGFIMPVVISALTPDVTSIKLSMPRNNNNHFVSPSSLQGTSEEWSHIYLLFGSVLSMSCLVFTFTASAERQKWAEAK